MQNETDNSQSLAEVFIHKERLRRRAIILWAAIAAGLGIVVTVAAILATNTARKTETKLVATQNGRDSAVTVALARAAMAEPWVSAGMEYQKHGVLDSAVMAFDSAIALNSQHAVAYVQRGQSLLLQDSVAASVASLKKGLELNRGNSRNEKYGHYFLAIALWEADKRDSALKEVGIVESLDSKSGSEMWNDRKFKALRESDSFRKLTGHGP